MGLKTVLLWLKNKCTNEGQLTISTPTFAKVISDSNENHWPSGFENPCENLHETDRS